MSEQPEFSTRPPDALLCEFRGLTLPTMVFRALIREKIDTIPKLVKYLETGLKPEPDGNKYIRNFGKKSRRLVLTALAERGIIIVPSAISPVYEFLPDDLWQRCLSYWQNACIVCGTEAEPGNPLLQDHWIPRYSKGFPGSSMNNIVPLCQRCNVRKSDSDPFVWLVSALGHQQGLDKMREVLDYFDWCRIIGVQSRLGL